MDRFTREIDSVSLDIGELDGENWNDTISNYFDKIKIAQDTLVLLIIECHHYQTHELKEQELKVEQKQNKEIELQDSKLLEQNKQVVETAST